MRSLQTEHPTMALREETVMYGSHNDLTLLSGTPLAIDWM